MTSYTTPVTGAAPNKLVRIEDFDAAINTALALEAAARATAIQAVLASNSTIYATVSAGLAATAEGGTFVVAAPDGNGVKVYREVSGAAVLLTTLQADAGLARQYAEAAAASAAAAARFDPDNFQPINSRLTALSGLPAPSARAALIGTAAGGYTNRGRARRVLLMPSQSNYQNQNAVSWTPPPNLFVWNGGAGGVTGTAFEPCPNYKITVPIAIAARLAEQDPDTDYYLVVVATGGTGIRATVGMDYIWSTSTSGDPGTGAVALDAGGTGIRYSETDADGYLRFFGTTSLDRTTDTGGLARVEVIADPTIYVTLDVTGARVDGGAYLSQACTISASASWPPANGTPVRLYPARHWIREVMRVNCEAALTALGLTGADRKFDAVYWWHYEADLPYQIPYAGRDFDDFMAYVGQWTDGSTRWVHILPWPNYATAMPAVRAFWAMLSRKCAENSTQRDVISLEASAASDWGDSNNVHVVGADGKFRIGRLIADAARAGGGGHAYASGAWVPTATLGANATAATPVLCLYQRVGDFVHVAGRIIAQASAVDNSTVVYLTPPVPSVFRDADDGAGVVTSSRTESGRLGTAYVGGVDVLALTWQCKSTALHDIYFSGMYAIR